MAAAGYLPSGVVWGDGELTVTYVRASPAIVGSDATYDRDRRARSFREAVRPGDRIATVHSWTPTTVIAVGDDGVLCRVDGRPSIATWAEVYWPVVERDAEPVSDRVAFAYAEEDEQVAREAGRTIGLRLRSFGLRRTSAVWRHGDWSSGRALLVAVRVACTFLPAGATTVRYSVPKGLLTVSYVREAGVTAGYAAAAIPVAGPGEQVCPHCGSLTGASATVCRTCGRYMRPPRGATRG